MPFLTELDSRAAVKGSRDPLGVQAIWTRLGRHVVGNLTTVSDSVRDFTVVLLGFHFVERIAALGGGDGELAAFLRWEQFAAYARAEVNRDYVFRGTERVRKNLSEGDKITLSASQEHQILSNQKTYGLWGLYIMPARASDLLEGTPHRLTPRAAEHVSRCCLPLLARAELGDGRDIVALLGASRTRLDVNGPQRRIVGAVARLLRLPVRAEERQFYRFHLLEGGPRDATLGRQRLLAALLDRTPTRVDFAFSPAVLTALSRQARAQEGVGEDLAARLDRIRASEALLAPAAHLFGYLLAQDGQELDSVAATVRAQWGPRVTTVNPVAVQELHEELSAAVGNSVATRWVEIANAMAAGEYRALLGLLLEQNRFVMAQRNGSAPWAEVRAGRLHVRFRDEAGDLPPRERLATLWRFPYFLPSLRRVGDALREPAA
jgi:hypothetical protein